MTNRTLAAVLAALLLAPAAGQAQPRELTKQERVEYASPPVIVPDIPPPTKTERVPMISRTVAPPIPMQPVRLTGVHKGGADFVMPGSITRTGDMVQVLVLGVVAPRAEFGIMFLSRSEIDCKRRTIGNLTNVGYDEKGVARTVLKPDAPVRWTDNSPNGAIALFACGKRNPRIEVVYPDPVQAYDATQIELPAWRRVWG